MKQFELTMKATLRLFVLLAWAGAALDTLAQPGIVTQPPWLTNCVGSTAAFSVVATGAPPVLYQWRERLSGVFTPIPDATNDTLVVPNVQATRVFDVVVTDAQARTPAPRGGCM
jgi:hypothetical protein